MRVWSQPLKDLEEDSFRQRQQRDPLIQRPERRPVGQKHSEYLYLRPSSSLNYRITEPTTNWTSQLDVHSHSDLHMSNINLASPPSPSLPIPANDGYTVAADPAKNPGVILDSAPCPIHQQILSGPPSKYIQNLKAFCHFPRHPSLC